MKKNVLFKISMLILIFGTFHISAKYSSALDDYNINLGETISVQSQYGLGFVDINNVNSKIEVQVEITNVSVYDRDGNVIDDIIEVCNSEDDFEDLKWYVRTGETLTFTEYMDEDFDSLQFETTSAHRFSLDLRITKLADTKLTIDCPKSITMKDNGIKKVYPEVYYGDEDVSDFADFKVKASKKNFVDIDTFLSDIEDYFTLYGMNKCGKCKITVTAKYKGKTCKDSFILNIKSTLKKNLYVRGDLYNYDTRNNIFKMSLTNRSKEQITIYSNGAVALDDDYVAFDRNVKMTKNRKEIVIKPSESKTISWKVLGKITWYDVGDFEIHFKCKYKGKVCWLSVQDDTVYVLKKGKWKKMS